MKSLLKSKKNHLFLFGGIIMGIQYGSSYSEQFIQDKHDKRKWTVEQSSDLYILLKKFEAVDKALSAKTSQIRICFECVKPTNRQITFKHNGQQYKINHLIINNDTYTDNCYSRATNSYHLNVEDLFEQTFQDKDTIKIGDLYWTKVLTVRKRDHLLRKHMDDLESKLKAGSKKLYEITYDTHGQQELWNGIVKIKEEDKFKELWRVKETVAMVNDLIEDATTFVNEYKK